MSVNPVNFSLYAQPNSFVLCSNQDSFQAPTGKINNVPSGKGVDLEAQQRYYVKRSNPQQVETQPSLFDQASGLINKGFHSIGSWLNSQGSSSLVPIFV